MNQQKPWHSTPPCARLPRECLESKKSFTHSGLELLEVTKGHASPQLKRTKEDLTHTKNK